MRGAGKVNEEINFAVDKPKDCKYCYFWEGRNKGCGLGGEEQCYYRIPDKKHDKITTKCYGCCYKRPDEPCIGYCMKKILDDNRKQKDR